MVFFLACARRNRKKKLENLNQTKKTLEICFPSQKTKHAHLHSLGDLGIGGLGISAGKIQLYVGGAGFHPEHAMPVILDAGTNRQSLLDDPSYLGVREPRLGDEDHMRAVVEFCDAVKERFPDALVQFEDFQTDRAFAILEKCRDRLVRF